MSSWLSRDSWLFGEAAEKVKSGRLEEPDENIQYLLDNADRMRDVLVVILMDRADREGTTPELDNMNKEIRPLAQDLLKIWVAQL